MGWGGSSRQERNSRVAVSGGWGTPALRRKAAAWLVLLTVVLWTMVAPFEALAAAPTFGPAPSETISVSFLPEAPYYDWAASDRAYLERVWSQAPTDLASVGGLAASLDLSARLLDEVGQLQLVIDQLRSREGYLAERGYAVYRAQTSGKLLALDAALRARVKLIDFLTGEKSGRPGPDFYPPTDRDGDYVFDLSSRANTASYPDPGKVVAALDYLSVEQASLDGYETYLLPYTISAAAGYGGLWQASIGAHEAGVANTDEGTATHEFAHHFSKLYLSPNYAAQPERWDEYIALRGLPRYQGSGMAGTKEWDVSTEEVLAEDFRVVMGNPQAASIPPLTAYGDPRGVTGLVDKIKGFFTRVVGEYNSPAAPSELAVGLPGVKMVIPRGISPFEPSTAYVVTDQDVLPLMISSSRNDVSFWLSRGGEDLQTGWHLPTTDGLYFGELRLTEGSGVYKLTLNAGSGSNLLYRAVYIVARSGAYVEPRTAGAGAAGAGQGGAALAATSPDTRIVWTSDPRLLLTGDLSGYTVHADRLTGSSSNGVTIVSLGADDIRSYGLDLDGGDGVYRLYWDPTSGAQTQTTVVVDQAGDTWAPVFVPAGQATSVLNSAVITDSRRLTLTGESPEPEIGFFIDDPSGQQIGFARADRAADGSFKATLDLPAETGMPAGEGLYSVIIAVGPSGATLLNTRWSVAVKLVVPGAAMAGSSPGGSTADSAAALSAGLATAERGLASGDAYWAGTNYLLALQAGGTSLDSSTSALICDGLLRVTGKAGSYLLTNSAAGRLVSAAGGLTSSGSAEPLAQEGYSYARAYRRREALRAFQAALAADPSNAAAADGLKLVNDPNYVLGDPSSPTLVYLTRLPDIEGWAKAIIERMNFKGVVRGLSDGTFGPDRQVRRDEAVAMVDRVLGLEDEAKTRALAPLSPTDLPYSDASAIADWARGYVAAAYAHGLIDLRESRFRAGDPATRAEVAVMLVKGLGQEADQAAKALAAERTSFADDARIPTWARGYLVYALRNGILTGYADNTMRPNDPVKRSEMAALAGRIDDRTTTTIDGSEHEGTMAGLTVGEPSAITFTGDATARILALNPSLYASGKAVSVVDLKPGSKVRYIVGDGGVITYLEVLAAPGQ